MKRLLLTLVLTGTFSGTVGVAQAAEDSPADKAKSSTKIEAAKTEVPAARIKQLQVYPPNIHLSNRQDRQSVLAIATRDDGVTIDVTERAEFAVAEQGIANIRENLITPASDGKTVLQVRFADHQAEIPIEVVNSSTELPISFKQDVMPVFARAGCNTGSCHGAARGKDGFRLSLFGFDPDGDYHRITREMGTRRVNLAVPESSLLMEKSIGSVPHTGGKRFDKDSEYYAILMRWLESGAPKDAKEPPTCTSLEIYPPTAVIEGSGTEQPFIARAIFSDGTDRDVTNMVTFLSNNENSAAIEQDGVVTADVRGEAFVMARYDTHTVGSQVLVLPTDLQYQPPKVTGNYIDQLVGAKLEKIRVLPSELCTDEEFLRRVTIDIIGLLPTEEEYHAFLSDQDPAKREKLVDRLLDRKEFSEIWAMKWAELLMIKSSNQVSYKSMFLYSSWLTGKIADNEPLDQIVRELLGASGGTFKAPATNYYQIERDTLKTAENVAQVFMGIRTQCAQCHNHPFDRWTMDDYYGFAAFFSQIGRKTGEDYRETIIFNRNSGDVRHFVDKRVMAPKFLGGDAPDTKGKDRRVLLAEWLTAPDNPYFATSVANRIWEHFLGRGIVHPVDDIRVSNPASNPQLFESLGKKLVEYKFDFKQLVRDICTSQTYQRSTARNSSNETDTKNFAAAAVRRIRAENVLDCISQVTETKDKFRGLPLGARAVQIADGRTTNYFLTSFGRAKRDTVAAEEVSTDPTLSQALHLLNGATVSGKISQGGLIKRWTDEGLKPAEVIEKIYIRALSRRPTAEELTSLQQTLATAASPQQGLEDIFWAVLNSREFLFNH